MAVTPEQQAQGLKKGKGMAQSAFQQAIEAVQHEAAALGIVELPIEPELVVVLRAAGYEVDLATGDVKPVSLEVPPAQLLALLKVAGYVIEPEGGEEKGQKR